jgi:hypothetical protein
MGNTSRTPRAAGAKPGVQLRSARDEVRAVALNRQTPSARERVHARSRRTDVLRDLISAAKPTINSNLRSYATRDPRRERACELVECVVVELVDERLCERAHCVTPLQRPQRPSGVGSMPAPRAAHEQTAASWPPCVRVALLGFLAVLALLLGARGSRGSRGSGVYIWSGSRQIQPRIVFSSFRGDNVCRFELDVVAADERGRPPVRRRRSARRS